MYRLMLLLGLLSAGSCHWGWDHNHNHDHNHGHGFRGDHGHDHGDWSDHGHEYDGWHGSDSRGHPDPQMSHEDNFNRLTWKVIRADRYAKHFCEKHRHGEVQEVYGDSSYQLIYSVPSSHVDKITVKINHRVIFMRAIQSGPNQSETFVDVRILPQMLKIAEATWKYDDGRVTVAIPYSVTLGIETQTVCADVTDKVIVVENIPAFTYKSSRPQ